MTSFSAKSRPAVVIVVFPDAMLLDIAGPMQVFSNARRTTGGVDYEIVLVSAKGGLQMMDTGFELNTEPMDRWRGREIHILLVAGGWGAQAAAQDPVLIENTIALAKNAARFGSVCTGAHVLAASGLLNGRRAVTHWLYYDELAQKYPKVKLERDPIFINDGNLWTSGGVTSGIDMALAMVAEDSGRKFAVRLARVLVMYMVRPGGQSQFSPALVSQSDDTSGRFDALHTWINDNLDQNLRIERLAEFVGMSARNFARVYRELTSRTPAKAVEMFRLAAARSLLEETTLPVAKIARQTGFEDDERMRRAIHRAVGISLKEYRERFGLEEKK